ncbi:unnamed protein product, partial [Closterium sp. Naga37s-1]
WQLGGVTQHTWSAHLLPRSLLPPARTLVPLAIPGGGVTRSVRCPSRWSRRGALLSTATAAAACRLALPSSVPPFASAPPVKCLPCSWQLDTPQSLQ